MRSGVAALLALALGLTACQAPDAPADISSEIPAEDDVDPYASHPREYVLPATVVPLSDVDENFGIDLTKLNDREVAVVKSAWENYQLVLAGNEPECPSSFGLSDGGSIMYECGAYDLMRVRGIAGTTEQPRYEYGPMLDFLNGHKVERLRFLTNEELAQLEAAP